MLLDPQCTVSQKRLLAKAFTNVHMKRYIYAIGVCFDGSGRFDTQGCDYLPVSESLPNSTLHVLHIAYHSIEERKITNQAIFRPPSSSSYTMHACTYHR